VGPGGGCAHPSWGCICPVSLNTPICLLGGVGQVEATGTPAVDDMWLPRTRSPMQLSVNVCCVLGSALGVRERTRIASAPGTQGRAERTQAQSYRLKFMCQPCLLARFLGKPQFPCL
jgi:hypothetical protein